MDQTFKEERRKQRRSSLNVSTHMICSRMQRPWRASAFPPWKQWPSFRDRQDRYRSFVQARAPKQTAEDRADPRFRRWQRLRPGILLHGPASARIGQRSDKERILRFAQNDKNWKALRTRHGLRCFPVISAFGSRSGSKTQNHIHDAIWVKPVSAKSCRSIIEPQ